MRDARCPPLPERPLAHPTAPDSLPLRRPPCAEVQSPTSGKPPAGSVVRAAGVEGSEAAVRGPRCGRGDLGASCGRRAASSSRSPRGAGGRARGPRRCGTICTLVGTLCQRRGPAALTIYGYRGRARACRDSMGPEALGTRRAGRGRALGRNPHYHGLGSGPGRRGRALGRNPHYHGLGRRGAPLPLDVRRGHLA